MSYYSVMEHVVIKDIKKKPWLHKSGGLNALS
jgi:hypothetical protein